MLRQGLEFIFQITTGTDMAHSPSDHTPASDDVIIAKNDDSSGRYTLGTLQTPGQFLCATYGDAIAMATKYVKTSRVRIWHKDGQTFIPLTRPSMKRAELKAMEPVSVRNR